jgi:amidase
MNEAIAARAPSAYATVRDLTHMLRDRKISATELLDLHLARVRAVNPALNAVVALDEDGARQAARRADAALAAKKPVGPLHGLPMTVKDSFEVTGMPTTCGIEALREHRPRRDADAVESLRAAGAVIFGKTNVPEGAGDHQSYNVVYGLTRNPWNLGRSAGGSSGGAAVAVATGMSPLEIGSDIGGSIRCPAHFCGVFGHKPSHGLVPLRGHIPPPPGCLSEGMLGVAGPLARSAYDLELALDLLARPAELDRKGKVWKLPPPRREKLQDFRVALWADDKDYPVDPGYLAAIHAFADDLRKLGVTVEEARPKIDPAASNDIYQATLFGIWGSGLPEEGLKAYAAASAGLGPDDKSWPARISRAVSQSVRDWNRLQEKREHLMRAWQPFFRDYDVLIAPVMTTPAFPHDTSGHDHTARLYRTIKVGSATRPYLDNLIWPGLITVANLPATAVPIRRQVDGVPVGVQVAGGFLEDRTTLCFAQLVEEEFGGFIAPDEALFAGVA